MKRLAFAIIVIICVAVTANAEESFQAFGAKVSYEPPNPEKWRLTENGMRENGRAYLLMFVAEPIKDSQGRDIEPVISIICEEVPESMDVIRYSISCRARTPFKVNEMMTPQEGDFTHANSVGFEGEYTKGETRHLIFVAHMRHAKAGVQIICDTTEGVYDKVEPDMRKFIRSVKITD